MRDKEQLKRANTPIPPDLFAKVRYVSCDLSKWDITNTPIPPDLFANSEYFNEDLSKRWGE